MGATLQATFQMHFLQQNNCEFRLTFRLNFSVRDQLTKNKCLCGQWLGTEQATSYYLNQWIHIKLTHICVTSSCWVDRKLWSTSFHNFSFWDELLGPLFVCAQPVRDDVVLHWLDAHTKWSLGKVTLSHFSNHHIYTSLVASLRHVNIYFQGAKQVIWKAKFPSVVFAKVCRLYLVNKVEAEWHIYASII